MKRILLFVVLATLTTTSYSQSLGDNDLGTLFTNDEGYGTARFTAMSGAFGALGGDISSIGINPAGGAIALNSKIAFTLGNRSSDINASYYDNSSVLQNDSFSIQQVGGILSFDSAHSTDWSRFALSFNYRLKNDFQNNFSVEGNHQEPAFYNLHPGEATPQTEFNFAQNQRFENSLRGESSVFSMGFSAAHQNKLFVGANINIHSISFGQNAYIEENNQDINGNELIVSNEQQILTESNGFSLSAGFIYKLHQNFRIGLAYETPTWYNEVLEDFYENYLAKTQGLNNFNEEINELYAYKLKTPSKITASTAILFNKQGLISVDYSFKDYRNISFSGGDFNATNQSFETDYRGTHSVNIGTEWRFDKMSLRGGYHYEQSPLASALSSDNIKGFSAGLGYNFGSIKIDLAYKNSNNTGFYNIYDDATINSVELDTDNSRFTGTISFNL